MNFLNNKNAHIKASLIVVSFLSSVLFVSGVFAMLVWLLETFGNGAFLLSLLLLIVFIMYVLVYISFSLESDSE